MLPHSSFISLFPTRSPATHKKKEGHVADSGKSGSWWVGPTSKGDPRATLFFFFVPDLNILLGPSFERLPKTRHQPCSLALLNSIGRRFTACIVPRNSCEDLRRGSYILEAFS